MAKPPKQKFEETRTEKQDSRNEQGIAKLAQFVVSRAIQGLLLETNQANNLRKLSDPKDNLLQELSSDNHQGEVVGTNNGHIYKASYVRETVAGFIYMLAKLIKAMTNVRSYGSVLHALALSLTSVRFVISVFVLSLVFVTSILPQSSSAAINEQLNFQGRLLTNAGDLVPDGNYHIRYKIYEGGDGDLGGGDETLVWTETRSTGNLVRVVNGYMSVQLGDVTAFGSSVDWGNSTLWLSIDIGGSGGTASWDGELDPFMRLTSTPYAFNANNLDGLDSTEFVQLAQGEQAVNTASTLITVDQAGAGDLVDLQVGNTSVFTVSNAGNTVVGGTLQAGATTFTSTLDVQGASVTIGQASTTDGALIFENDTNAFTTTLAVTDATVNRTITFPDATGTVLLDTTLATTAFVQNGNSFTANAVLGTNDTYSLSFETDGTTALTIDTSQNVSLVGTLAVNGDSITADGATLTINAGGAVDIQDNLTADSITTDVGGATIAGDVAVNGGDITSTAGTLNINAGGNVDIQDALTADSLTLDTGSLTFTGVATDITTGTNEDLTVIANGVGAIILDDQVRIGSGGTIDTATGTGDLYIQDALEVDGAASFAGNLSVATGSQFTNASSTLFTAVAITDKATGGDIGTAATTVDVATTFNVNQTTASQSLTLPTPTDTTSGRVVFVNNVGSANFTMYSNSINAGSSGSFIWNGSAWVQTISFSSTGVETVGAIDTQTKSANGAVISGTTIYFQTADGTYPGLVSVGSQTFAGDKTFSGDIAVNGGNITSTGALSLDVTDTNSFTVTDGTNTLLTVADGGTVGNVTVSGTLNAGATTLTSTLDVQGTSVTIGQASTTDGTIIFENNTNAFTTTVAVTDATTDRTITLPDATGTVILDTTIASTAFVQNGNSFTANAVLGTNDTYSLVFETDGTTALTIDTSQGATFAGDLVVSTGSQFTNASSTLLTAKAVSNLATGGDIGTAAATVDVATTFDVNQTTASQAITLPDPTDTTSGRIVYVNNVGSVDFTMYGDTINSGSASSFMWNGSSWIQTISFVSTGVESIGALDGQSKVADGAVKAGTVLHLQTADASYAGLVSTAAQTFAGAKTFNGLVNLDGGIAVDTSNFTVSGTTGDVLTAGDLAVNGGDITSTQATLTINAGGAVDIQDNLTADSITTDVGGATIAGDVAVNGGDITTNQTTFNLVNATATTLNIGGAATTIELGAATGSVSINNSLTVDGNLTIGDATTDRLTVTAQILGATPLVFQGATDNGSTTTFAITDPTGTNTITFPDASGTVLLSGGNIFTLTDGTTPQTIDQGDTLTVSDGTDTDLVTSATDTLTVNVTSTLATVTGRGATTTTLVNLDGGIAVDTSNFTVSGTTGDILTAGDLAVNGGDITSTQATLTINAGGAVDIQDNLTADSITTDVGGATIAGDVAVNGGDITTNQTTFNLVNATATTLNIGGAATTIELGAATGSVSINNSLTVDGNLTIGDATTDRLTVTAQILGATPLVFQGATDNGSTTTFAITDPTGTNTITFPDASGTVLLSGGNIFTLTDGTTPQTIDQGDTLTVSDGTDTDLVTSATDTLTVNVTSTLATVTGRGATTTTLVNLDGGIAVDTGNFTVSGTTGDVLTAGDLAVNGGDITSTQATLTINAGGAVDIQDNLTADSITTDVGGATIAGDVAVNGGDITTNQTTFNLVNATATTLNIGGAATTIELGAATGSVSINNSLTVDGNLTIGDATTDRLTVTAQILGATPLVFQGATDNGSTTTFAITDPTGTNTITFPDASGTVLLSGGNIFTLTDGTTPQTIDQGDTLTVSDGTDTDLVTSATDTLTVNVTSTLATVTGRGATTTTLVNLDGGIAVDTGNFTVSGTTGAVVTASTLDVQGSSITVGQSSTTDGTLIFENNTNAFTTSLVVTDATVNRTITLPDATGTVVLDTTLATTAFVQNGNSFGATAVLGTNDSQSLQFEVGGVVAATIADEGAITLQNETDSLSALRVLNAAGTTTVLNVDTTNGRVGVGTDTPGNKLHVYSNSASTRIAVEAGTDGAAQFTLINDARTWNVGLNSSDNFQIRDNSGGANVILLEAGAPVDSIRVDSSGQIGFGVASPTADLTFNEGAGRSINVLTRSTNTAGNALTVSAGNAGAGGSAFVGGQLNLQGGSAAGTGNANGGNIVLSGGAGTGTGTQGLVIFENAAFNSVVSATCGTSCTITQSDIDAYSNVVVEATATMLEIIVPDPSITTAGRVMYITAADGTNEFTLTLNDGAGTEVNIGLRENETATLIWNGSDWTGAGASSSTTLQSAYNNTLTSAGGAELVLNAAGGAADGLTIRNNDTTPIVGGLLEVQSSIGTNLFSVNNRGTELASNGGSETLTGWSTDWTAEGASTISRTTTSGEYVTGQAGAEVITTSAADDGIQNNLSASPTASTDHTVSFTAKLDTGTFTDIEVVYTPNGGSTEIPCTPASYSTRALSTTVWTKVTCTITTDGTSVTNPDIYIRQEAGGTARTFWIDNLSFQRNDGTTEPSNVQIGGGLDGGPITLFTLDRASAPPVADGNDEYLGSMYYDTITGRIQCYEADGWGACGSPPNNIITLTPEYAGSVLNGTGVGTMSADFCSDESGVLQVNATICASGEAVNYYEWTSPQATAQTYSIYLTFQLPSTFKEFIDNNTITLDAYTTDTTKADVNYQVFASTGSAITECGSSTNVTPSDDTWLTQSHSGNENSTCNFAAGDRVIFKLDMIARDNETVYVSDINFTYTND